MKSESPFIRKTRRLIGPVALLALLSSGAAGAGDRRALDRDMKPTLQIVTTIDEESRGTGITPRSNPATRARVFSQWDARDHHDPANVTQILITRSPKSGTSTPKRRGGAGTSTYNLGDVLTKLGSPKMKPFSGVIESLAGESGVDPALVRAVIHAESHFNPKAVSSKGAGGLMQLMPATAKRFGVTDRFSPEENIRGGVAYLRILLREFGDPKLAVAAYNAGEGAVRRYKGIPPYEETRIYVTRVMSLWSAYQSRYGQS